MIGLRRLLKRNAGLRCLVGKECLIKPSEHGERHLADSHYIVEDLDPPMVLLRFAYKIYPQEPMWVNLSEIASIKERT